MKFCVSYSSTHEVFLKDFFLKTFPFEEGVTLIVVTHEDEVAKQAKRVIHMKDGKIIKDQILETPAC